MGRENANQFRSQFWSDHAALGGRPELPIIMAPTLPRAAAVGGLLSGAARLALLAGSVATAMFQAEFFTLACLIGYRVGGWRLMHDSGWSLRAPWLWWVYVLFAAMMWHGAFYWTADAKRLAAEPHKGLARGADWTMTAHGLLFLVIFAIAFNRGGLPLPQPCRVAIVWLEHGLEFLPSTWRSVGAAIALWGSIGLLTGCAFRYGNGRKRAG